MYNYPVLIHYHRKDEAYQSCNFSKKPADSVEFVKEQEYFGDKFSFTQSSETPLEQMVFTPFIILKTQPLQVHTIKIKIHLLLIKRLTVLVLITTGVTKESWDARFLKKKQALNFGRQQQQLYKL